MRRRFRTARSLTLFSAWLVLALLLAACGALPTNPPEPAGDTRTVSPIIPTAAPPSTPLRLVVLHTNDNWGETEPCG